MSPWVRRISASMVSTDRPLPRPLRRSANRATLSAKAAPAQAHQSHEQRELPLSSDQTGERCSAGRASRGHGVPARARGVPALPRPVTPPQQSASRPRQNSSCGTGYFRWPNVIGSPLGPNSAASSLALLSIPQGAHQRWDVRASAERRGPEMSGRLPESYPASSCAGRRARLLSAHRCRSRLEVKACEGKAPAPGQRGSMRCAA